MNSTVVSNVTGQRNVTYCDFKDIGKGFQVYYSYLSVTVCIFGSVTNVLNICVLTTKQMRCPTNFILTGLALANLLVMLEYIPFVFQFNENKEYAFHFTYNLAVYIMFHALFAQAVHFISCCLTVILAIWQYIAVKCPQNNNKWCGNNRTKVTIFLTYLLCPIVCIPLYLSIKICERYPPVDENGKILSQQRIAMLNPANRTNATIYVTDYEEDNIKRLINFYVYGIVIKLIPCLLLTVLSCLLIVKLLEAKERRKNLMNPTRINTNIAKRKPSQRFLEKEKQADRTTRMLLAVLLLFLMVEFPQAILGLLAHIIGKKFEEECYRPLGDIVDVFTLTNSSINFILYCIMSKKFRLVFKEIFYPYIPCTKMSKENWISLQTLKTYV